MCIIASDNSGFQSDFSTLLGYTQQELEHYFADYLARLVQPFQVARSELLRQIAYWYNGYSWDGVNRVYVPFSTMLFLEMQTFENHWFATGTPTFLIKLLRQKQAPAYALESITADTKLLNSADVNQISVVSLLFQTGYLTIKQVQRTLQGQFYELGYPNYEVAHAFQQHLLVDYLEANPDQVSAFLLTQLRQALQATNIDAFIVTLQAIFADIPSQLFLPQEAYYHSVVYLVLRLLGFTIQAERMTNVGRIDAVLELADKVYILEWRYAVTPRSVSVSA